MSRASPAFVRFGARVKDGLGRVQSYMGGLNTVLLVSLLAPAVYGSEVVNGVVPLTTVLSFAQFIIVLYALFACVVLFVLWMDNKYFRGAEHARANSFNPFAFEPALNVAWRLAQMERAGVDVRVFVERYAREADQLGGRARFMEYLEASRQALAVAPSLEMEVVRAGRDKR